MPKPEVEPDRDISERLNRLNRWGGQTMYPFLLSLYERDEVNTVDAVDLGKVLGIIESFLVRRLFAGVPTAQLNRLFTRLAHQLPPGDVVTATRATLSEPSRRWPDDEAFRDGIHAYPLYTDSRAEQRRVILESFELSYGHKEPAELAGLTVEHVMPQDLTDPWRQALGANAEGVHARLLHTLGNLTLTGYNQELSNRPFDEKRVLFEDSHLAMNTEITAEASWGAGEIRARSDRLAEKAILQWPGPDRSPDIRADKGDTGERAPAASPELRAWSPAAVEAIVADYFEMLALEIAGVPYSKAERRRALIEQLDDRNEGAVERKHMNISAVLVAGGLRHIDGYKPLAHGQLLLNDTVERYLEENPRLRELALLPDRTPKVSADLTAGADKTGVPRPTTRIFALHKGSSYDAELDEARMIDGRGQCVTLDGQRWLSPSRAASEITHTEVNGWKFWRYQRRNGTEAPIDELR